MELLEDRRLLATTLVNSPFDGGIPSNVRLLGSARHQVSWVELTPAQNSKTGTLVVNNHGLAAQSFTARFNQSIKDTTTGVPADGITFGYGDLPNSPWGIRGPFAPGVAQDAPPGRNGLFVKFDTFPDVGTIQVFYNRARVSGGYWTVPLGDGVGVGENSLRNTFQNTTISMNSATKRLTISHPAFGSSPGRVGSVSVSIPNWNPSRTWKFGLGASTGSANDRHIIEDLYLRDNTSLSAPDLSYVGDSGTRVDSASLPAFTWRVQDFNGDSQTVQITLQKENSGGGWSNLRTETSAATQTTFSPEWHTLTLQASDISSYGLGTYRSFVRVTDRSGRVSSAASSSVTIIDDDIAAPNISVSNAAGSNLLEDLVSESHARSNAFQWTIVDLSGRPTVEPSGVGNVSAVLRKDGIQVDDFSAAAMGTYSIDTFGPGLFELELTATDADADRSNDASTSSVTARLEVTNEQPVVDAGIDIAIDEGQTIDLSPAYSFDADGDALTFEYDFGDTTTATGENVSHLYADSGTYTVTLVGHDPYSQSAPSTLDVRVQNLPPRIVSISAPSSVLPGQSFELLVTAEDVAADVLTFSADFDGDGQFEAQSADGRFSHAFAQAGVFAVPIRVSDDEGATSTSAAYVLVGNELVDPPVVTLSPLGETKVESGEPFSWSVTLDRAVAADVIVPLDVGGTALLGVDYQVADLFVRIAAGEVGTTFIATLIDDEMHEATLETLSVTLGQPINAVLGTSTSDTVSIEDDDLAPQIRFLDSTRRLQEDAGVVPIRLGISEPSGLPVEISLAVTGTASADDYELVNVDSVVIPAGSTGALAWVRIIDDSISEPVESIVYSFDTLAGATVDDRPDAASSLTWLLDRNDAPVVSVSPRYGSVSEGTSSYTLTATLDQPYFEPVTVPVELGGVAVDSEDFTLDTSSFFFPTGETAATIEVSPIDDSVGERDRTLVVSLHPNASPSSVLLGPARSGIVQIRDDDTPIVSFTNSVVTVWEDQGSVTGTVELSQASSEVVRVPIRVESGTALRDLNYSFDTTWLEFGIGETRKSFAISIVDDTEENADRTVGLRLGAPETEIGSPSIAELGRDRQTLRIRNEDTSVLVRVGRNELPRQEATGTPLLEERNGRVRLWAEVTRVIGRPVTVNLDFLGDARLSGSRQDYSVSGTRLTIPANQKTNSTSSDIFLTGVRDNLAEGDERIRVRIASAAGATATSAPVITIEDADEDLNVKIYHKVKESGRRLIDWGLLRYTNFRNEVFDSGVFSQQIEDRYEKLDKKDPKAVQEFVDDLSDLRGQALTHYLTIARKHFGNKVLESDREYGLTLRLNRPSDRPVQVELEWFSERLDYIFFDKSVVQSGTNSQIFTIPAFQQSITINFTFADDQNLEAGKAGLNTPGQSDIFRIKSIFSDLPVAYNPGLLGVRKYDNEIFPSSDQLTALANRTGTRLGSAACYVYAGAGIVSGLFGNVAGFVVAGSIIGTKCWGAWDGYPDGATAYFDANNNRVRDFLDLDGDGTQDPNEPLEPSATVDAGGQFALDVGAQFDLDQNGEITPDEGRVVVVGGVDSGTGLPLTVPLVAPYNASTVNALTTLSVALEDRYGYTPLEASAKVAIALDLPGTKFLTADAVVGASENDPDSRTMFASGAQVYNTLVQISELVGGLDSALSTATVSGSVIEQLSGFIADSNSSIDLSDPFFVAAVIDASAKGVGVTAPPSLTLPAAQLIGEGNRALMELNEPEPVDFLRRTAQIQKVMQSAAAADLKAAAAGTKNIGDVVSTYTGSNLQTLLDSTDVDGVRVPRLQVEAIDLVEGAPGETGFATFTVTPSFGASGQMSVDYRTLGRDDALAGVDFQPAIGTLVWASGDMSPRIIQVPVYGDADYEADESITLLLENATRVIAADPVTELTILNDDAFEYVIPGELSESELTLVIGESRTQLLGADSVLFESTGEASAALRIVGNTDVSTQLTIDIQDPTKSAEVEFIGQSADDRLVISNAVASSATHDVFADSSGRYVTAGLQLTYQNSRLEGNSLVATAMQMTTPATEGSQGSWAIGAPNLLAAEDYAHEWSISSNQEVIAEGVGDLATAFFSDDGFYELKVTTTGPNVGTGTLTFPLEIINVAPTPTLDLISSDLVEETAIQFLASATDPAGDNDTLSFSYEVLKDGVLFVSESPSATTTFGFTPDDNGDYKVTLTVADEDGGSTSVSQILTVANAAPVLQSLETDAESLVAPSPDLEVELNGAFSDVGLLDSHTVMVDWGDGSIGPATVDPELRTLSAVHAYGSGGFYEITVMVTDKDGGLDTGTTTAAVQGAGTVSETLWVIGTEARDKIDIDRGWRYDGSGSCWNAENWCEVIEVRGRLSDEWFESEYRRDQIVNIHVVTLGGKDSIDIGRHVDLPVTIDAGAGDDRIDVDSGTATVWAGPGHDRIKTRSGDDFIDGGEGNDDIWTDGGNDTIVDLQGHNEIRSGTGNDTVNTGAGDDLIWTDDGDDQINDLGGDNRVYAGAGNDSVVLGAGNDRLDLGNGDDSAWLGAGNDYANGDDGDDIIFGEAGDDWIDGDRGNDVIVGGDGNDRMYGDRGLDLLIGGWGADRLDGGRDDDLMIAGWTVYDDDVQALGRILDEWASDQEYAVRVDHLRNGTGAFLDGRRLAVGETVFDDDAPDRLDGDSGRDWFFASLTDDIKRKRSNELLDLL